MLIPKNIYKGIVGVFLPVDDGKKYKVKTTGLKFQHKGRSNPTDQRILHEAQPDSSITYDDLVNKDELPSAIEKFLNKASEAVRSSYRDPENYLVPVSIGRVLGHVFDIDIGELSQKLTGKKIDLTGFDAGERPELQDYHRQRQELNSLQALFLQEADALDFTQEYLTLVPRGYGRAHYDPEAEPIEDDYVDEQLQLFVLALEQNKEELEQLIQNPEKKASTEFLLAYVLLGASFGKNCVGDNDTSDFQFALIKYPGLDKDSILYRAFKNKSIYDSFRKGFLGGAEMPKEHPIVFRTANETRSKRPFQSVTAAYMAGLVQDPPYVPRKNRQLAQDLLKRFGDQGFGVKANQYFGFE